MHLFNYSPSKENKNTWAFHSGTFTFYQSYNIIVAFSFNTGGRRILITSYNKWVRTTGKHLSWVRGGDVYHDYKELPSDTFQLMLNAVSQAMTPDLASGLGDELLAMCGDIEAQRRV